MPRTLLAYTRAGEKGRLSGGSRYSRELAKTELLTGEREGQCDPDRTALVAAVLESKAKITIDRQRQREAADQRTETVVAEGAYRWPCWNCWDVGPDGVPIDRINEQGRTQCYGCIKGKPKYLNSNGRDIRWICPNCHPGWTVNDPVPPLTMSGHMARVRHAVLEVLV